MSGIYNLYIPVCGLLIALICIYVFFSKEIAKNKETDIFSRELIYSLIDSVTMIAIISLALFKPNCIKILEILNKLDYSMYILFFSNLFLYICYVTSKRSIEEKNKTYKKIFWATTIIDIIFIITLLFTKVNIHNSNNAMYSDGPALNSTLIVCALYFVAMIVCLVRNIKTIVSKKMVPLYVLIILFLFALLLNQIDKTIVIISAVFAFVNLIMLFTVENPDMKMVEKVKLSEDAANKANMAKSEFLANMSHEIRTPLNAIVGFSEALKEDRLLPESREKVNDIIMASDNLLDIVNGILDISKIEANKIEIVNKDYYPEDILNELIALTRARIGDKGLDFRYTIDPSIPTILYGDGQRLKQVVLNILTNAVKYTKQGYVDFRVSSVIKDNVCRLIISVDDSGIGIKKELLPKIFDKFDRLQVENSLTVEGTGLGLAITKKLVELMNGKIIVQSEYGKGSRFTISIDQRIVSTAPREKKVEMVAQEKTLNVNGAKVLVVDDNELNLKVANTMLKKYGFNIEECTSGFECISKIQQGNQYDIILLDDMMPKMTGKQTLVELRKLINFNIPVIALTANAIDGMREEYINCGFNDYLSKPIVKHDLERVIQTYIHNTSEVVKEEVKPLDHIDTNSIKKILVVDDNELNNKLLINFLKGYNYEITAASSGKEAITYCISNTYDLILLDDKMPELDGTATKKELDTLDGFTTPVVMLTASPEDEVKEKIEPNHFAGYLGKPLHKDELDGVLKNILENNNK